MKTLFKIIRSSITSFLCLLLFIGLSMHLIFSIFHFSDKKITNNIDRDFIANKLNINDDYSMEYINEYIEYVFYNRSYPNEYLGTPGIQDISHELVIDNDVIISIRNFNNIFSNNSHYLLLNIGLFVIFLIMWIVNKDLLLTFKIYGLTVLISSIVLLIGTRLLYINFLSNGDLILEIFKNIIDNMCKKSYMHILIVYLIIGVMMFSTKKLYIKYKKARKIV